MTIILLPQTEKRRFVCASNANPLGSSPGAIDQLVSAFKVLVLMAVIKLLSSMLTYTFPFPSVTENSGFPASGMVAITLFVTASSTVLFELLPLKVKTILLYGS